MKTYPYTTDDGIIELVRKDEHNAIVSELLSRLEDARQSHLHASARDVQTIQRQSVLLDRLATALKDCKSRAMDKSIETHADDHAKGCVDDIWEWAESALAAYARDVQTIQRQSVLLDRLAQLIDDASEKADDGDIFKTEWETQARAALAAYESAKKGTFPDPLAEAVKRMEAVPWTELRTLCVSNEEQNDFETVRTRLISAAKGEQP
jgi:hypothetical protein